LKDFEETKIEIENNIKKENKEWYDKFNSYYTSI
jgi:hypothetical protein